MLRHAKFVQTFTSKSVHCVSVLLFSKMSPVFPMSRHCEEHSAGTWVMCDIAMQHIDDFILKDCTQKVLEMSSPLLPNYKLVLYHLQHSQVSACVSDDMISLSLSLSLSKYCWTVCRPLPGPPSPCPGTSIHAFSQANPPAWSQRMSMPKLPS